MKFTSAKAFRAVLATSLLTAQLQLQVVADSNVNPGALEAAISCNEQYGDIEFIYLDDEAVVRSIEDDIRADLAEIDALDHGKGTMEAIYWGSNTNWGRGDAGGPWVMAGEPQASHAAATQTRS